MPNQFAVNPTTGERLMLLGNQWVPAGNSPKSASLADKEAEKRRQQLENAQYITTQVKRAKNQSSFFNTGFPGAFGSIIPGSSTKKLESTLAPIKANLSFEALKQMRDASPTGGALGNVSNEELALLAASAGSLDVSQGEEQLDRSLNDINKRYLNIQRRLMGTAAKFPIITNGAVTYLRANPGTAKQFDVTFGPGTAAAYLKSGR